MAEDSSKSSPRILSVKWGKMKVDGIGDGKDFKLWPGGGRSWNWREYGTTHSPGIQPGDCEELLEHGCRIIVLSRGMYSRLKVTPQAIAYLEENEIEIITEKTKKAVQIYNSLVEQDRAVGGLFHSTC